MLAQFLLLSAIIIVIGLLSFLIFRQYHRVQRRDAARRRIQAYQISSISVSTPDCDPFDHSLYWYPVAFSHEVISGPGSRPFGFILLNEPLCLYRRNDGEVVCVLDLCPHRSAPLSLGQISKSGNLECIYHGWQYGANGQCVYIPSVSKGSKIASVVCARTRPVHEQYGFIWIWPGKRELAHKDLIPHGLFTNVQNKDGRYLLSPEYACDLNIPYELMVDNLLDMAHVDFTHDGTMGKRSQASCMRAEHVTPSPYYFVNTEASSFKVERHDQSPPYSWPAFSYTHFIPPCFVLLENHGRKNGQIFHHICIILPSGEHKMRLLLQFYRNFARFKWIEYIPGYDYLTQKVNKSVVDQDILLLNGVQRNIATMEAKPLGTTVSADAPIKAFRRFQAKTLDKFNTIYVKNGSWSSQKKIGDETVEVDIEDLKLE